MATDICYPTGTDWGCAYDEAEIELLVPATKERSEALAWSTLSALTGYRVSLCPVVIRPCALRCGSRTWDTAPVSDSGSYSPYISGGSWYNACGCTAPQDCSCSFTSEVLLPTEVGRVVSVSLDGAPLDPSAYRVDNGNRLVRTDGETWPLCQDMNERPDAVGSFAVSYYTGVAPNDLLRYAAGVLATEFYKACSGGKCRLPSGVTSVTRSGISMEIPSGLFPGGATGIHEVDAVIRIYNPYSLKSPARVMSPDVTRGRIQTGG